MRPATVVLAAVATPLILVVIWFLAALVPILFRQHKLLHWPDHQELLSACRVVIAHRGTYRVNPNVRGGDSEAELRLAFPDPQDPTMPEVIRGLAPTRLRVEPTRLGLEMGGGMHHFGIVAFQPGAPESGVPTGSTRLRDGLWYYTDFAN